ncbi:hypothetical protein B0J13DRAFT_626909 [Dactylonectria estremocensis]|uniref:Uncharacterized protein n=1 Tax=Dactylonectria estremocensis TaxID=1079267 RepID=A0A9P9E359_9HYPO|nr:hypothetical protein B0J13DRAFT_626909 [Dactylonectria estremocensis]
MKQIATAVIRAGMVLYPCTMLATAEDIEVAGNCGNEVVKRGSMAKAVPGVPLDVINDQGKLAANLQEGDVAVLSTSKYPRRIEFVSPEWLPKTDSGKVKRAAIRHQEVSKSKL